MADNGLLQNSGITIDELNKIRLVPSDVAESSATIRTESENFIQKLEHFDDYIKRITDTLQELGKISDAERLRAMSAQNAVKNKDNQREEENRQIQIIIRERQIELERLKVELQALQKIETQQAEYLQKLRSPI
uniref:Intraflagellar transport protein 20 n=1 Tax=Acrobeloides nanus TaxID=290746 RepID=A0A914DU28_9BILA